MCLIMIGEKDFEETNNYLDIIYLIKKQLENIQNTNIILCLPTYRYGKYNTMYNWRVEHFNNLLYLDTQHHGYAVTYDTNCSYHMTTLCLHLELEKLVIRV